MFDRLFGDKKRPAAPVTSPFNLEPESATSIVAIWLAQAELLERLGRSADRESKLRMAMTLAKDFFEAHRHSAPAILSAARAARAAKQLDLAASMLSVAHKLSRDEKTKQNILYEENLLTRERAVASSSLEAMARELLVYACQKCGRLVEYISIPCMSCGWCPATLLEVSHSGRLARNIFSLWELLSIGRGIVAGRKATEVVVNLADVAAAYMADPQSLYRHDIEAVFKTSQNNLIFGNYFFWNEAEICKSCGTRNLNLIQDAKECHQCKAPWRLPPPLRLLMCLTRLSIHFQHNFEAPKSNEFDLFIRYLVFLQSKLYRTQETPSGRERTYALDLMTKLARFEVVNSLGEIIMSDLNNISYQFGRDLSDAKRALAETVLNDFRNTLQFFADRMSRSKALS